MYCIATNWRFSQTRVLFYVETNGPFSHTNDGTSVNPHSLHFWQTQFVRAQLHIFFLSRISINQSAYKSGDTPSQVGKLIGENLCCISVIMTNTPVCRALMGHTDSLCFCQCFQVSVNETFNLIVGFIDIFIGGVSQNLRAPIFVTLCTDSIK